MNTRIVLSLLLSSLMAGAWAPVAQAPAQEAAANHPSPPPVEATTSPATPAADPAAVSLRGPFGRVPGGTPDEPAAATPPGVPLDAFVRRAPLVIEMGATPGMTLLEVIAQPIGDPAPEEILSLGGLAFEGPDRPGTSLLTATVADAAGTLRRFAWRVDVPDRDAPADGLYDIPAPEVIIESDRGQTAGLAGSGCYAYLCVDTGGPLPLASLEALPVRVGEVVRLRLSDGSGITAWEGSLSPLVGTRGRPREASATLEAAGVLSDGAEGLVALAGLEPPAAGEWLLRLKVVFDRERGWLWNDYRLAVD